MLLEAPPRTIGPFREPEQLDQLRVKPVKFIVGHEGAEFYLHPGFVSRLSDPLDALVRSGAEGSSESCISWKKVETDVFLRFAQFVYTGSYASLTKGGESIKDDLESISSGSSSFFNRYSLMSYRCSARHGFGSSTGGFGSLPAASHGTALLFGNASFIGYNCNPCKKRALISTFLSKYALEDACAKRGFQGTRADPKTKCLEQIIGHVKMWNIADRFAVNSLMDNALFYLAYELAEWAISPSTFVPQFGGLVHYVYRHGTGEGCQTNGFRW
ncbi:hypothetical protein DL764_008799 [Monosporascus ibericus]|uniref:BTB domain-containing protein n=1 Tax=Monosporascus ibericus TaxID=155417 RepID=A0A4Q4T006_9PEZI|nr:hypothetical protein DL764_008799 [Monosporascus ibericus]